ncbi:hypothetical protein MRB53_039631 [Persea americana]|nr:hypothetical protein MRB53_039631 [Persea americana]
MYSSGSQAVARLSSFSRLERSCSSHKRQLLLLASLINARRRVVPETIAPHEVLKQYVLQLQTYHQDPSIISSFLDFASLPNDSYRARTRILRLSRSSQQRLHHQFHQQVVQQWHQARRRQRRRARGRPRNADKAKALQQSGTISSTSTTPKRQAVKRKSEQISSTDAPSMSAPVTQPTTDAETEYIALPGPPETPDHPARSHDSSSGSNGKRRSQRAHHPRSMSLALRQDGNAHTTAGSTMTREPAQTTEGEAGPSTSTRSREGRSTPLRPW